MYGTPFYRVLLHLSNDIRHVMPSTDKKRELQAKNYRRITKNWFCCQQNQPFKEDVLLLF